MLEIVGIWIGILAVLGLIILAFIKANLNICPPNEVLIFSGKKRRLPDGTKVGYRIIKGGRGFKIPIVETVHRMSLATIPIEIEIKGALSSGIIPLNIKGMANIKVAGTEDFGLSNAVERFLGKTPDHISQVAREVLEGNLRGVLATLSPEEANSKRLEFAKKVMEGAKDDLKRLGLVLDTLKILNISDEQRYLESIGRKKNAEVHRDANIAEAEADSEARTVSAEARKNASIAEFSSDLHVVEAENQLKVKKADLLSKCNIAEAKANVAGDIARIQEEKILEREKIELNENKYKAQTIVPAMAEKEAKEMKAKGEAAKIIEDGKATAESVRLMRQEWEKGNTRELFLIQLLPDILGKITGVIKDNLAIEKVTVIDSGGNGGVPSYVKGITGSVISVMEQLKSSIGLDIPQILSGKTHKNSETRLKKEYD